MPRLLMTGPFRFLLPLWTALALPFPASASADPSDLCQQAASRAARETGVPYEVLLAISLVETGRNHRPWPWTVNAGGDGTWYDSAAEAETRAAALLEEGRTNVDLGCFQLNYRWHAEAFASLTDMLDPDQNAAYAAGYLAKHYAKSGDWALAAAAYHSATPEHAEVYRAKFETAYASLGAGAESPPPPPPEAEAERLNRFPLLLAGAGGRNGSLVPSTSGGVRLIGAP
jgi:Transglycosylase SLT domain